MIEVVEQIKSEDDVACIFMILYSFVSVKQPKPTLADIL